MLSTAQKSEVEVNSEFCISRRERVPATEDFFFFLKKCAFLRQSDESAPLLKKKKKLPSKASSAKLSLFLFLLQLSLLSSQSTCGQIVWAHAGFRADLSSCNARIHSDKDLTC